MSAIKHYTTSTPGIGGIIKRRISDFIVEEMQTDGKVCGVKCFTAGGKTECDGGWAKLDAPKTEGSDYLHLTLEKFNMETQLAIRKVARYMQFSRSRIGYAGLKDKRAITSQRISVWKPDAEKLAEFESRYICLREPEWVGKKIEIGDLAGNRFRAVIRNIALGKSELKKRIGPCMKEMPRKGIANYFGEQRFGGARGMTHLVGREFIKGNVEDAVMLYLTATYPLEEQDIKAARMNLAKTGDFGKAVREFPNKYRYERTIIHHLCKHPKDFAGAFRRLPKSLCYLFTHAYQAYLFNKVINKRIETGLGLNAVEGDILEDGIATAPLYGFESVLAGGRAGEIEQEVLGEEGFSLGSFKLKSMPELSSKGARKKILLFPQKLKLISIEDDELNEGMLKATVGFELSKGNYATTVLREMMKAEEFQNRQILKFAKSVDFATMQKEAG